MIQKNPFTLYPYTKLWSAHFINDQTTYSFNFLKEIAFYKIAKLPVYVNIGKNMTKGISYILNHDSSNNDYKNKVVLIYDVPEYFDVNTTKIKKELKLIKVKQYPGFLTNLESFSDFNSYFSSTFNKKSRYKLKSYIKTLESSFNVSYKHFYGNISETDYNIVFDEFNILLKKRFLNKQETNNNLEPKEWDFYKESTYPLILEKKASLFVIYKDTKPIAMSLNYFSESILFFAITVFDIDYNKFNIGKVHLMKLYEWCFNQNITIFDLSKGDYEYKERWSNVKYYFENHIYYDKKSLKAYLLANIMANSFKLKQLLRNLNLNKKIHQITFLLNQTLKKHKSL